MDKVFMDYSAWMSLLKGNYRKGAGSLRGILSTADTAQQLCADNAAVMAIYGDVDYTDGSCLCAKEIGGTAYAPDAFNHYLQLMGVTTYDSWDETTADYEVLKAIAADEKLYAILLNSPALVVPKRTLKDDSWETISQMGTDNLHRLVYSIGDTKDIELTDIGTMTMEIADFDHDYLSASKDADTAPITFLTRDLLYQKYQMNTTSNNKSGYNSMPLRTTIEGLLGKLSSDLKNKIRTIYKTYGVGDSENSGWYGYKIWIPVEWEFLGIKVFAADGERNQGNARMYPIFMDYASRVKRMNNGNGSTAIYWTASARYTNNTDFAAISAGGSYTSYDATTQNGVCFGFCV